MTGWDVSAFARRGTGRDELQDVALIGPVVIAAPTDDPVSLSWPAGPLNVAVFDGMGGVSGGRRAALVAATGLASFGDPSDLHRRHVGGDDVSVDEARLRAVFAELGHRVNDDAAGRIGDDRMGTAAVIAAFGTSGVLVGNVGDSRGYVSRDGYLCQLTVDHSFEGRLTQCLGAGHQHVVAHVETLSGTPRLRLLLCSDGLYRHVTHSALEEAMRCVDPIVEIQRLSLGAADDVTAVVVTEQNVAGDQATNSPTTSDDVVSSRSSRRWRLPRVR